MPYGSNDIFPCKVVLLGIWTMGDIIWGNTPNTPCEGQIQYIVQYHRTLLFSAVNSGVLLIGLHWPCCTSVKSDSMWSDALLLNNVCYYYYYRKKRFRWRNVKRLQGHLTNAKDSDKTRVRRTVRTECLSDAIVGRAAEIRMSMRGWSCWMVGDIIGEISPKPAKMGGNRQF